MASSKSTAPRKGLARVFTVRFGPAFGMNERLAEFKALCADRGWRGTLALALEHWALMTPGERGAAIMRVVDHRSAARPAADTQPILPNGWRFHRPDDQAAA